MSELSILSISRFFLSITRILFVILPVTIVNEFYGLPFSSLVSILKKIDKRQQKAK